MADPHSLPLLLRVLICALFALAAAAHLYSQRRTPPGWRRLVVATPVFFISLLPPLMFDPFTESWAVMFSTNFPWFLNCGAFGWATGRGYQDLESANFNTFFAFLCAPALPYRPAAGRIRLAAGGRPLSPHTFNLPRLAAKPALLAAAAYVLVCLNLPHWLYGMLQSVTLYIFTSLAMESAALLVTALSGLPVVPQFDEPYLSSSFSEFWSCRWNIVAGAKFRTTVFEPICNGLFARLLAAVAPTSAFVRQRTSPWRRLIGVCATFAASGIVHEAAFWYLTRHLSGNWMLFFSLQGPLLIAEAALGRAAHRMGIRLPLPLKVAMTVGLLHLLAQRLFFPDLVASGLPQRMLRQLRPFGSICTAGWRSKLPGTVLVPVPQASTLLDS